jgi:hypothetical protein
MAVKSVTQLHADIDSLLFKWGEFIVCIAYSEDVRANEAEKEIGDKVESLKQDISDSLGSSGV